MKTYPGQAQTLKASSGIFPKVINYLEQGEIVILPMATVYVFAVRANYPQGIAALRRLKGFGDSQPLALITRGDRAHEVVELKPAAERMMTYMPCPITMIVKAKRDLDPGITCGFSNIFITCPDQFIYDLVGASPFPIACASLKVGGQPITRFDMAQRYFSDQVNLIVDGGTSLHGRNGTMIDFTLEVPTIMNFGPISVDDLRPLLPEIILPSHLMK